MDKTILAIAPYQFLPPSGGGQRDIYFSLQGINAEEKLHCLTVQANTAFAPFLVDNSIQNSVLRYINPFFVFHLIKTIKKNNIGIVLVYHPFLAWQALLLKRFLKFKVVLRSQNIEYERFRSGGKFYWKIIQALEHWAHKKADYNLFITDEDLDFAIKNFPLPKEKCTLMPYGVEGETLPNLNELDDARLELQKIHKLPPKDKIILFNGTLSYFPNEDAVKSIVTFINPELKKKHSNYKIIICGKGLNQSLVDQIEGIEEIIYTGFVDDINLYFKGSDILLNPVVEGGGVKTKLVEALGFGKAVVSYKSGSYGVNPTITGGRLHIVEDYNAQEIVNVCLEVLNHSFEDANTTFYANHNWNKIASNALIELRKLSE